MSQSQSSTIVLPPFNAHLSPLNLNGSVALVTGGGQGIGLGISQQLIAAGCKVIITGRHEATLQSAQLANPRIDRYYVSDATDSYQRRTLIGRVIKDYPTLSILVNNAGIQHRRTIAEDNSTDWSIHQQQIDVNLSAPIHYINLLLAHLLTRPSALIINITSGAAFIPSIYAPEYGATKAALHHYTLALRASLVRTNIRVVELVPPAVRTGLGDRDGNDVVGVDVESFCKQVMGRVLAGEIEVGFGMTEEARVAGPQQKVEAMQIFINRSKPKLVEPPL